MRLGRTIAATYRCGSLVVLGYALQDLVSYFRTVTEDAAYWTWASSSQGVWMLTEGLAEAVTVIGLVLLTIRLLSGSPIWKRRPVSEPVPN